MPRNNHIIIAAMRTGSTTLNMAMNELDGVRSALEPFLNEGVWGGIECRKEINHLLQYYNGYKDVVWRELMPYHFLEFAYPVPKVILLRKNILQKVVSEFIARDISHWGHKGYKHVDWEMSKFEPDVARGMFDKYICLDENLKKAARVYDIPVVYYEDFFISQDVEDRLSAFDSLLKTFGYDQMTEKERDLERVIFAPSNKSNSAETYQRIPNIDEIESLLGSDDNGWIFSAQDKVIDNGGMSDHQSLSIRNSMSYYWRDQKGANLHVVGSGCRYGTNGQKVNDQKAFNCWREGAERGNLNCMRDVEVAYRSGIGTKVNTAEANKWRGMVDEYLRDEEGVPDFAPKVIVGELKDMINERLKMRKPNFHIEGDDHYHGRNGKDKSNKNAFVCWSKGAELGNVQCMKNLAWAYSNGIGTIVDGDLSKHWEGKATTLELLADSETDMACIGDEIL